jgi:hypothetical protein
VKGEILAREGKQMNIVTGIMRQLRRVECLRAATEAPTFSREGALADLADAVLVHTSTAEAVLAGLERAPVASAFGAHRVHHACVKMALFHVATCKDDALPDQLAVLGGVLREHARHEAVLVNALRSSLGEELLDELGAELAKVHVLALLGRRPGGPVSARLAAVRKPLRCLP